MKRIQVPILCIAMSLAALSAPAPALETWGPTWSEVTGARWSRVSMNRAPAIIKSVDGRDYTDRVVKIEPGARRIVVQSPTRQGFNGADQVLELSIEPCKRYYVNAQFDSSVGPRWKAVVARKESIAGCKVTAAAK